MFPRQLEFHVPDAGQPDSSHLISCTGWGTPEAAETVICVHGLTRNGRDFDFLARELSSSYHVLCPDMPGRGKSQWLADPLKYNNSAYVSDIQFILSSLNITRVHWIGTSMGGIMGLMAANMQPGLIQTLALNDIGCVIPAAGLRRIVDIADFKTTFATRTEAEDAFRMRTATFGIRDAHFWQHLFEFGMEEYNGSWRFTYDPGIFSNGAFSKDAPLADVSLWPFWEAVSTIPVLTLRGQDSDILLHDTAIEMQTRHPNLLLHELPGVGHAPALMEDKQIALIHDWMSANKKKKETM